MGRNSHCRSRNRAKSSESTGVRQQLNNRNVNRDSTLTAALACRFDDCVKFIGCLLIVTPVRTVVSWSTSACNWVWSTALGFVMSLAGQRSEECCGERFSGESSLDIETLQSVNVDSLPSDSVVDTDISEETHFGPASAGRETENISETKSQLDGICPVQATHPQNGAKDALSDCSTVTGSVAGSEVRLKVGDKLDDEKKQGTELGKCQPPTAMDSRKHRRHDGKHNNNKQHTSSNETTTMAPSDPSSSTMESSATKETEQKSNSKSKQDQMGVSNFLCLKRKKRKTAVDNEDKKQRDKSKNKTGEGSSNLQDSQQSQLPVNSLERSGATTAVENDNSSLNDTTVQGSAKRPDDSKADVEKCQHENAGKKRAKVDEIKFTEHQSASIQPGSTPNENSQHNEEQKLEQQASKREASAKTDLPSERKNRCPFKIKRKKKRGKSSFNSQPNGMQKIVLVHVMKQQGDEDKKQLINEEKLSDEHSPKRKRGPNDDTVTEQGEVHLSETDSDDHATLRLLQYRPVGLKNLGNTCYFNAVMQNLYQTFLLKKSLCGTERNMEPLTTELVKFYNELDTRIQERNAHGGRYSAVFSPRHLLDNISQRSQRFQGRRQHDSHEVLRHVMDGVKEEEKQNHTQKLETQAQQREETSLDPRLTVVDKVFGGHYLTVFYCKKNHPYHLFEPFLDVSLQVVDMPIYDEQNSRSGRDSAQVPSVVPESGDKYLNALSELQKRLHDASFDDQKLELPDQSHLLHCLRYFTRKEHLDEYMCLECNQGKEGFDLTSGTKKTIIYNPPAVLTIHLKRFEQDGQGYVKVNKHVIFDTQIDLAPFCSKYCKRQNGYNNILYNLYGIVVHRGSLKKGHYTAHIRVRDNNVENTKQFLQTEFLDREALMSKDKLIELLENFPPATSQLNPTAQDESSSRSSWWFISDDVVRQESVDDVLRQKAYAYLLFYERIL